METVYIIAGMAALVVIAIIVKTVKRSGSEEGVATGAADYHYGRKDAVMTSVEASFYNVLLRVAGDRYYIFPQIHLSALLTNQTRGRYWKAAFQRINRVSVDYVLCEKQTMRPVYAVELDDATHDTEKRRARDDGVNRMLASVNIPLVRFRNVGGMTDEQIANQFAEVAGK